MRGIVVFDDVKGFLWYTTAKRVPRDMTKLELLITLSWPIKGNVISQPEHEEGKKQAVHAQRVGGHV